MTSRDGMAERALAARIEALALQGACADPRPDKTDWIRMWAAARDAARKPASAGAWREACAAAMGEEAARKRQARRDERC